jgi:hypothetical protein
MKFWQCSMCRQAFEDCKAPCKLITDDDVTPTECVRFAYIFEGKWYTDDTYEHEIKNPQPHALLGMAKWEELIKEEILEVLR